MARKTETVTTVTDDLTGEPLDPRTRPTEFTYRGRSYSLDLGPDSVKQFEAALKPYIGLAVPIGVAAKSSGSGSRSGDRRRGSSAGGASRTAAVRAWAVEQGLVAEGSRGRISRDVQAAYDAAHSS